MKFASLISFAVALSVAGLTSATPSPVAQPAVDVAAPLPTCWNTCIPKNFDCGWSEYGPTPINATCYDCCKLSPI